ncbi:hypothetical protein ACWZEH_35780 (plasmid) [Streptomyces sp. QTS137]
MTATERFVWLPVTASACLRPRLLRAFAALAHAVARNHPLTSRVLAEILRHHSGRRAGHPLTPSAVARIIEQLDASGWITVHRRAGERGRHLFLVHDGHRALGNAVASPAPTAILDDGSGARVDERSLALKEDHSTDRPENEVDCSSPAVGERQVVGEPVALPA